MLPIRPLLIAACVLASAAHADDHARLATPLLPAYKQECSACHVAYLPGLLPAASWARVLSTLPRHYGTDASLDAPTVTAISTWLAANAGSGRRGGEAPPDDRITRSAWFVRKHDEVPAAVWKRPAIKSPSHCVACHGGAEHGDFNEHRVRIPR
jgi:hypothetical protein